MKRVFYAFIVLATLFASDAFSQLVAEQITRENASRRLFSGSDANGGIGDWYLSNGIVEAVIDNVAFNPDIAAMGVNRPNQNGVAPTGGTLIDIALVGQNNDQFNQMFQVVNLVPNDVFFYTAIRAAVTPERASIIVDAVVLQAGVSTLPGTGGPGPTLVGSTIYSLAPGDRFITITSTVVNMGRNPAPVFNITDGIPFIGRTLLPFVPAPGRGFSNPTLSLTPAGVAAAIGVFPFVITPGNISPDDGMMDTVSGGVCGEVSYGFVPVSVAIDPDGPAGPMAANTQPVPALLGVNSALVSGLGNPFDPTRSPMLQSGASFTYTRRILVGDRNDVSSLSNLIYPQIFPANAVGTLTGDIDAIDTPDVQANLIFEGRLTPFFGERTAPVTQVRTDKTGKFSVVLPAGEYTVNIVSPERNDMTGVRVTVAPGTTTTAAIDRMSATGSVRYAVTERNSAVPAKVTFVGIEGTPNPNFSRFFDANMFDPMTNRPVEDLLPSSYTSAPALNMVFSETGSGRVSIKPGRYQVFASRGTEYTVAIQTITVEAGRELNLNFAIERVIDTTGFVSADFHVHSGRSFDSSATLEDRIRTYVAEGLEVIVSTDHDFILDYAPVVQKLNVGRFAKTIVGEEITTNLPNPVFPNAFGHHNAFPLNVQPLAPRDGAINDEYVPAATFYDRIRMLDTGMLNDPTDREVIQLNHPRAGVAGLTLIGLFNIINFNPIRPLPIALTVASQLGTGTRNIDFDAMELFNGDSIAGYQVTRADWFGLLNQGFFKTATAVSDSHRQVVEVAGMPRTYVAAPTDDPAMIRDEMITDGVLAGRASGTSGPFIRFDINGQGLGSLVKKRKGKVSLNILVTAPAWVPVEEVRIYNNGKLVMTFDSTTTPRVNPAPTDPTSNQGIERFRATVKLKPPKGDSYYTVEAGTRLPRVADTNGDGVIDKGDTNGDGRIDASDRGFVQPPSPTVYAAIAPGFVPLGFTNPIFIDRNGNDKFDAPGIDSSIVPTAIAERGEELDQVEEEQIDRHHIYYPFFKMQVGTEEMQRFFDRLSEPERKMAQPPIVLEEGYEKVIRFKFDLFNLRNLGLWSHGAEGEGGSLLK